MSITIVEGLASNAAPEPLFRILAVEPTNVGLVRSPLPASVNSRADYWRSLC